MLVVGTLNPYEYAPAVRFCLVAFSVATFSILFFFVKAIKDKDRKRFARFSNLIDCFWFLLFSSVCIYTTSRPRGSSRIGKLIVAVGARWLVQNVC